MPQHIFDPHIHFISLEKGDYHWLRNADDSFSDNIQRIKRNFSAADLELTTPFSLRAVSHIEAGFDNDNPERELAFIGVQPPVRSAISYIPLNTDLNEFTQKLALLMLFETFVGIRDISENDDYLRLKSRDALLNLALLAEHGLLFEAQFNADNEQAVSLFNSFARQLPYLTIVINHCGLPDPDNFDNWRQGIMKLSEQSNIAVKFCGFEMLKKPEPVDFKQGVLDVLLAAFSENRVMFASNFPLCLTQKPYQEVWEEYSGMRLTPQAWRKLSFDNAERIYTPAI